MSDKRSTIDEAVATITTQNRTIKKQNRSQEMREPPSQEMRHKKAKAKSSDEFVTEGILTGKELQQILGDLADQFDNDGALALPSGQWGSFLR